MKGEISLSTFALIGCIQHRTSHFNSNVASFPSVRNSVVKGSQIQTCLIGVI